MIEISSMWIMLGVWSPIVALGAIVAYFAFAAWRRQRSRAMLALGSGFVMLSAGPAFAWCGIYYINEDAIAATVATVIAMSIGFLAVIYSLRTRFS